MLDSVVLIEGPSKPDSREYPIEGNGLLTEDERIAFKLEHTGRLGQFPYVKATPCHPL